MKRVIIFFIIVIMLLGTVSSFAEETAPNNTKAQPLIEDPFQDEPSVEDLMLRKIDLLQKVEKIEKIESVVDGANPIVKTEEFNDRKSYKPLRDGAEKQLQASPPFRTEQP